MICFFAATPLQMLTCINIHESRYSTVDADIFLLTYAVDLSIYQEMLNESHIFKHIYVISKPFNKKGRFHFFREYLFPDHAIINILTRTAYSEMFSTKIGPASIFYYTFLLRKNRDIRFVYYEEGIGDYWNNFQYLNLLSVKIIELLGYKNPYKYKFPMWMYLPEYLTSRHSCSMVKIPCFNSVLISNLKRWFKIDYHLPADCQLIYFEQPFYEQQGIKVDHNEYLDILSSVVSKQHIYVKLHPRSSENNYVREGYKILDSGFLPWELLLLSLQLDHIILVSISSTATISPKMLFNYEPPVMLLYKCIFSNSSITDGHFFDYIENLYVNKNNFTRPKNIHDIPIVLHKLLEHQKQGI